MQNHTRRAVLKVVSATALLTCALRPVQASMPLPAVRAYKQVGCPCCDLWAQSMKDAGFFNTWMVGDPRLDARRAELGVPSQLAGCHLALLDKYVIEGHVPPLDIMRLLNERPDVMGLAVPGMPSGSPGMETDQPSAPYDVFAFTKDGNTTVFA